MLQQTRVDTVIPYFERWMEAFPALHDLAAAGEEDVLRLWEGLGYYSRARNLYKAACLVVEQHEGILPQDRKALENLPGIGEYTAGAILSIAFEQDEPAVDGNVGRVFARLFNIDQPIQASSTRKEIRSLVKKHLPSGAGGAFNQALMDLGAKICLPGQPRCEECPVIHHCQAYQLELTGERPVMRSRPPTPHYTVTAAIIQQEGEILLAQRPKDGLLGGMWEFPGGKVEPDEDLHTCLEREIHEELGVHIQVGDSFGVYEHAYTHFRVTLHAYCCRIKNGVPQPLAAPQISWVRPEGLELLPMGKIDRQIASRLLEAPCGADQAAAAGRFSQ
jgi:A/G-specific adenine glycosylase